MLSVEWPLLSCKIMQRNSFERNLYFLHVLKFRKTNHFVFFQNFVFFSKQLVTFRKYGNKNQLFDGDMIKKFLIFFLKKEVSRQILFKLSLSCQKWWIAALFLNFIAVNISNISYAFLWSLSYLVNCQQHRSN